MTAGMEKSYQDGTQERLESHYIIKCNNNHWCILAFREMQLAFGVMVDISDLGCKRSLVDNMWAWRQFISPSGVRWGEYIVYFLLHDSLYSLSNVIHNNLFPFFRQAASTREKLVTLNRAAVICASTRMCVSIEIHCGR